MSKLSGTLPHEVPSEADEAVQKVGAAASSAGRLLLAGARQVAAKQTRGLPTVLDQSESCGAWQGAPATPEPGENTPEEAGTVTIKVWEARGIPKMDRFGKTDAFARVAFGGVSYGETEVVESQDPYWGTEYRHAPNASKRVVSATNISRLNRAPCLQCAGRRLLWRGGSLAVGQRCRRREEDRRGDGSGSRSAGRHCP